MIEVVIAGLGRVGAMYPEPEGMPWRTHVSAIKGTSGLNLVAIVDPDPKARTAARQRHALGAGVAEADSLRSLPGGIRPDVVVLAGPADARADGVAAALALGARLIFCEKPLAGSVAVADRMLKAAAAAGAAIRVNFQRRLDPAHVRARTIFPGRPLAVEGRYAMGLDNYGSHLIDLLVDWFGPPSRVRAKEGMKDPSLGFHLQYSDGLEAVVMGLDGARYDVFDVDLHYSDGRLELANGGVERRVWRPVMGRHYPNYAHLAPDVAASNSGPMAGLGEFYGAARDHLRDGAPLPGCDGATALLELKIIEAIRRSAKAGGAWISWEEIGFDDTE